MRRTARVVALAAASAAVLPLAACGSGGSAGGSTGLTSGPIDIWYSTNEQEVAWGDATVEAWNAEHPDEKVTAQPIPAGSSSAITRDIWI